MVKAIVIPQGVTNEIIKDLLSLIDDALTRAQFDYARAKRAYENLERRLKTTVKSYYVGYKDDNTDRTADAKALKQAAEEGLVAQVQEAYSRYMFMDAVVSVLDAKRGMLITDSAILKIEAGLK